MPLSSPRTLLVVALLAARAVPAAEVASWFTESGAFLAPGFAPTSVRDLGGDGMAVADGADTIRFQLGAQGDAALQGLWRYDGALSRPIARLGVTGAQGPGRVETDHVFFAVGADQPFARPEQGGDGRLAFVGRAGSAALGAAQASRGLWLHDGVRNVEIARAGHTGALGPGLGAGVVFEDADAFVRRLILARAGRLVAHARVGSTVFDEVLLTFEDGAWRPCAADGSADPDLAPGVASARFDNLGSGWAYAVDPAGRVYGVNRLDTGRFGVWRYCDGAPRALALENAAGSLGPGLAPASRFTDLSREPLPLVAGAVAVYGIAKTDDLAGTPALAGYFRLHPDGNRPIALALRDDATGPPLDHAIFQAFPARAAVNGGWLTFEAEVQRPAGVVAGYFRHHDEHGLETVALADSPDSGPTPGTLWATLLDLFPAPNGDVVVYAAVCARAGGGATCADVPQPSLWRVPRVGAPQRVLGPGDTLRFATPEGAGSARIAEVARDGTSGSSADADGRDGWISRAGVAALEIRAVGDVTVHHVRATVFDPGALFGDGFEAAYSP